MNQPVPRKNAWRWLPPKEPKRQKTRKLQSHRIIYLVPSLFPARFAFLSLAPVFHCPRHILACLSGIAYKDAFGMDRESTRLAYAALGGSADAFKASLINSF